MTLRMSVSVIFPWLEAAKCHQGFREWSLYDILTIYLFYVFELFQNVLILGTWYFGITTAVFKSVYGMFMQIFFFS